MAVKVLRFGGKCLWGLDTAVVLAKVASSMSQVNAEDPSIIHGRRGHANLQG